MDKINAPFFCGGVLFFLLTQATLPNGTSRDHRDGVKDDHSEPILMRDLIYAFTGSLNYGAPKDTSKYKDCLSEGSVNVPFNITAAISAYDDAVRNRYKEALGRMDEFVAWHLDPDRRYWLIKALLDIIENDEMVGDEERFYIFPDGGSAKVDEIKVADSFELPAFLVGALHYILTRRNGLNSRGEATLDSISSKSARKPRVYTGHLGEGITRRIEVEFLPSRSADTNSDGEDAARDDPGEAVEPEVMTGDGGADTEYGAHSSSDTQKAQVTVIQQQINVIQNGGQNANVTNNGTMTINL